MKKNKIVFMGTPDFAVPILQMLIDDYGVELVITQPDKKVGRKKVLTSPPIKELAIKYNIPVLQPEKLSKDEDTFKVLENLSPDIIITAAYGQLVPERILNIPKYKCVNVHGSLLPKLRGGAPIQYAIMEGFKETGITIMYMEKKLDAGDMISKITVPIKDTDNYLSLHNRLSLAGRDLLKETLPNIFSGDINPEKQDESEVTFAKNILREDENIHWYKSALEIRNKIRALDPFVGAYTILDGKILKIWTASINENSNYINKKIGEIISQNKDSFTVFCGNNTLLDIKEIQLEGKKRTTVKNFLSNGKSYVGNVLGQSYEKEC